MHIMSHERHFHHFATFGTRPSNRDNGIYIIIVLYSALTSLPIMFVRYSFYEIAILLLYPQLLVIPNSPHTIQAVIKPPEGGMFLFNIGFNIAYMAVGKTII